MVSGEGNPSGEGYWKIWMHFSNCTYKGLTKEFLTKLEWAPMKGINEATGPRISTHLCLKAGVRPLVFQHWDSLIVYYFTFGLDSWGVS